MSKVASCSIPQTVSPASPDTVIRRPANCRASQNGVGCQTPDAKMKLHHSLPGAFFSLPDDQVVHKKAKVRHSVHCQDIALAEIENGDIPDHGPERVNDF